MRKIRITAFVFALIFCLISVVPSSVSAADKDYSILNYEDFVSQTEIDQNEKTVYITFPTDYFAYQTIDNNGTTYGDPGVYNGTVVMNHAVDARAGVGAYWPGSFMSGYFLDAENIPDGAKFTIGLDFWFSNYDYHCKIQNIVQLGIIYYDADFKPCGYTVGPSTSWEIDSSDIQGSAVTSSFVDKPSDCKYLCYYATMNLRVLSTSTDLGTMGVVFEFYEPVLSMSIKSMLDINNKLDRTNQLLEKLPDDIKQGFKDVIEEEQNKAQSGGNANVGKLEGVIPNKSAGFMEELQEFAASLSYEGTDAVLNIPGIVLPAVAGMFPATEILPPQQLDFGEYVQMLPSNLLLLVQSILTIALIVYCFKELYDTISYVLTMRRGSDG